MADLVTALQAIEAKFSPIQSNALMPTYLGQGREHF
jgi:hypothetical protein